MLLVWLLIHPILRGDLSDIQFPVLSGNLTCRSVLHAVCQAAGMSSLSSCLHAAFEVRENSGAVA